MEISKVNVGQCKKKKKRLFGVEGTTVRRKTIRVDKDKKNQ